MLRQNSGKKNVYETGSTKCGWLRKQGGIVKSWHQRWFILKADCLYYFAKEMDTKSLGTIFLPGNHVNQLPLNLDDPGKFLFEIIPGGDKTRMTTTHETYLLCADSDDERKEWIQAIQKTIYGKLGGAIFGQSLTETMTLQRRHNKLSVPNIVKMCIDYIRQNGMEMEGIFRLAGRSSMIRELKDSFQRGDQVDFSAIEGIDVHTVGSLLKRYLSELPQPIIPLTSYEKVIHLVTREMQENPQKALESLSEHLVTLPKHNYNLLQCICQFLCDVCQFEETNKMSSANLATVFVTGIIRPDCEDPALLMGTTSGRTLVIKVLIDKYRDIFKMEYSADGDMVELGTLLTLDHNPDTTDDKTDEVFNNVKSPSLDLLNQEFSLPNDLPKPIPAERIKRKEQLRKNRETIAPNSLSYADQSHRQKEIGTMKLSSSSSSDLEIEDFDSDSELDALLNADLFQFDLEEIHTHMDMVRSKVADMKNKYRQHISAVKNKAANEKVRHKRQIEKMAQNLEKEKNATCDVVSKVVSIQSQLQTYQLKYGFLD